MSRPKAPHPLLEISPYESDGGQFIGRDPRTLTPESFADYHTAKNPMKVIRERCLDCCCGDASEIRKCISIECPGWPYRMGSNPFRAKTKLSPERRAAAAEHLRKARKAKGQRR